MELDPAAAAIAGFRRATECTDAVRNANWRAVQERLPGSGAGRSRSSPARAWVIAVVAVAAGLAMVWIGAQWWSSAREVIARDIPPQASDIAAGTAPGGDTRTSSASLPPMPTPVKPVDSPAVAPATVEAPAPRTQRPVAGTPSAAPQIPAAPTVTNADSLAHEARLILRARDGIATGNLDAAITALDQHAKLYPEGGLSDDRWTLRVGVQCAANNEVAAGTAAASFLRARPESVVARRLVAQPCTEREGP